MATYNKVLRATDITPIHLLYSVFLVFVLKYAPGVASHNFREVHQKIIRIRIALKGFKYLVYILDSVVVDSQIRRGIKESTLSFCFQQRK